MGASNTSYYEQANLWDPDFDLIPGERERLADTIDAIPDGVRSLLDVGCGNGYFLNALIAAHPDRFDRVVGLDRSEAALRHVRSEVIKGSVTELPFETGSFNLVACLEVLEHLPFPEYQKALDELVRVSGRYILITVPNAQDLLARLTMCPKCRCCFNPCLHVRSFDTAGLERLLPSCEMVQCREIGPLCPYMEQRPLIRGMRLFAMPSSLPRTAICPQCGYQDERAADAARQGGQRGECASRFVSLARTLAGALARRGERRPWLLALYVKSER